jgi:two-component system cell cycle sensor histidine kinase/response regulator CckA
MSTDPSEKQREHPGSTPTSAAQFQQLVEVISRSQHRYRELIDNLDQAVFTLSLDGEVRVANRRLSEVLGVPFPELIGHPLGEFIESPTFADLERSLPAFLQKGVWSGTLPVRIKKDKELRHFACWFQTVVEEGQVTCVTGWARDVTVQHESEIRFTELFESLREGIIFATPEGRILDANPALVAMLGYESKEDLAKRNLREIYDDPSSRDTLIRRLAEKGFVQDYELVLRRKDGKRIHCLTSGFAIRDVSGRPVRLQGTLVDVTERVEIERSLRREQEFVRRLIHSFPDLIAVLDSEGRFTYVTERVKEVLGLRPQDFLGQRMGGRTHPEDQPRLAESLESVMTGRKSYSQIEYRVRHADGSWRTLLGSAGPLFDEAGRISGIVQTARDVTESKLLEEQSVQKEKFAAMGQMMAGAAHELNNPLTAILGVSDLLRERAADDATRRQVDLILQQARRAASIVQDLLAFSRPPTQARSKLRLDEMVQEALQLQQAALGEKNIRVKLEVPGDLPAVEGDRKLLMQVFLNIIENAAQAMSAARDHGTLEVSLARVNDRLRATFADDGPGISPEHLGKIFDPFFTTKRPGGGSGLGLTICLALVKEHGGTIEVQSTRGAGAAFHILLPVAPGEVTAEPQSVPAAKSAPSGSDALRGHTVLIVDDEESIREIIEEGLSARGMEVHAVESSEAALSYLATNAREVILCDFNLPGLNGHQLFERLRARLSAAPPVFVFMTGDLVDEAVSAQFAGEGVSILQKPFHISALAALLAERLQPQPSKAD